MPLGVYKRLVELAEAPTDVTNLEIIAALCGETLDEVMNKPIAEVSKLSDKSRFLAEQPRELNGKIANRYKVGRFDCVPVTDMQKMTTAQYIDFQTYASEKEKDTTAELLTCLLVPTGKKYNDGYDVAELRADIEANLSVIDAMNLANFFLSSLDALIARFLTYSEAIAKRTARKARKTGNKEAASVAAMISTRAKALTDLRVAGAGLLALTRRLRLPALLGIVS